MASFWDIPSAPGSALRLGLRVERSVRGRVARTATDGALAAVDALLASRLAREALDRILASELVDSAATGVGRHAVIERVTSPLVESGALETMVLDAIASNATDELAERVLDAPAADRLVARLIESRVMDQMVERLLESEDLWLLVEVIARSQPVTDAISSQSLGMADQFAAVVRRRSVRADDRVENAVRGFLRRNGQTAPEAATGDEA